jgi:hypothetical protein
MLVINAQYDFNTKTFYCESHESILLQTGCLLSNGVFMDWPFNLAHFALKSG